MVPGPIRATTSMTRPLIAAALLTAVIIGGISLGVLRTVAEDIGIDW